MVHFWIDQPPPTYPKEGVKRVSLVLMGVGMTLLSFGLWLCLNTSMPLALSMQPSTPSSLRARPLRVSYEKAVPTPGTNTPNSVLLCYLA